MVEILSLIPDEKLWSRGTNLHFVDTTTGSMKPGLLRLKQLGFEPKYILDVGANLGDWSRLIQSIYPNAIVYMIEASETCRENLLTTGNLFAITLVGNDNKIVDFYENPQGTGNSMYKEKTEYFAKTKPKQKQMYRLDTLMNKYPPIDMLKLDIQGAELDALKGASRLLKNVEVILCELSLVSYNEGAPGAMDTLTYLHQIGFELFDFIDFNNLKVGKNFLGQADTVLVRRGSWLFDRAKQRYERALADEKKAAEATTAQSTIIVSISFPST